MQSKQLIRKMLIQSKRFSRNSWRMFQFSILIPDQKCGATALKCTTIYVHVKLPDVTLNLFLKKLAFIKLEIKNGNTKRCEGN